MDDDLELLHEDIFTGLGTSKSLRPLETHERTTASVVEVKLPPGATHVRLVVASDGLLPPDLRLRVTVWGPS